jgi:alpha-glucosidase
MDRNYSAFSIIMKTNEGSKPNKNWQFVFRQRNNTNPFKNDKAHKHLKPYLKAVVEEYYQKSLPTIRHPYIHYEHDEMLHQLKYHILLGRDLLLLLFTEK